MQKFYLLLFVFFSGAAFSQSHSEHRESTAATNPDKAEIKEETRVPIDVPVEQQTKIGLKLTTVEKKAVEHTIRTVGTVAADQTKEAHVHTKINGWIEKIYANYIGMPIKKGQPLYELYSPDLVSTQEEYLAARTQGAAGREIALAAFERLKLWGVSQSELERLKTAGKAKRSITFASPASGFIINKTAISGMYINPEMVLYLIADLSRIWIVVTLYEYDLPTISVGDEAEIQLPYDPNKFFKGKIAYIYPEIELESRTAKARIEIDNPDLKLKPGMFANVALKKHFGESVVVPEDAVIDTGSRKIVFVKVGASQFEPREVKAGPRVGNTFIIFSGLQGGEEIVTSAHFLIDAESKFQAAIKQGATTAPGHGGHGEK